MQDLVAAGSRQIVFVSKQEAKWGVQLEIKTHRILKR